MEALCATKGLLATGWSGWTTSSAGTRREGGARCLASRVLRLDHRAPSGRRTQHGGLIHPIFVWRRATTVAPAFLRRSSPFSAFSSAEKPEKADADTETSEVQTQTASELPKPAAESKAAQIRNQTESEVLPTATVNRENAEVVQSRTATEPLEPGEETEVTQVQANTSSESLQASAETETTLVETQTPSDLSNSETEPVQVETQAPTVRARFMLQKPCKFGEQFLLVGEDPILGLWDPANAIPLEWSKGHLWATEVVLPVGKEIKFKIILRQLSGKIKWQPGLDRVLQTRETTNTIVVAVDWESAVDQEIMEKDPLLAIPAEGKVLEDSTSTGTDGEAVTENNQAAITAGNLMTMVEAEEEKPILQAGDPILIPGLASLPISSSTEVEAASSEEVTNGIVDRASLTSGEIASSAEEVNVW